MIDVIENATGKGNAPIYQLKVVLLGTEQPVWRLLQVPGDASLDWLHAALQVAIGWTNSHLYQFMADKDCYSDTRHNFAKYEGDPEILEALDQATCRDPDDDWILATGLSAEADLIVTGDKDLLVIESFRGMSIIGPRQCLERLMEQN